MLVLGIILLLLGLLFGLNILFVLGLVLCIIGAVLALAGRGF